MRVRPVLLKKDEYDRFSQKMRVPPVLLKKDEYDRFKKICVDEPAFFENFFFLGLWENWGKKFFFGFSEGKK